MNEEKKDKKKKVAIWILLFLLLAAVVVGIIFGISKDKTPTTKSEGDGIYTITILESAHGSVTSNKTEAKEGEEIVVTVTPDEGYELSSLKVNKKESETTFKMPAENVKVLAKFALKDGAFTGGTFFGKSGDFYSSDVIDFSTDNGLLPHLVLDATKATPLYAYINDLNAKQFYLKTKVEVTDILDSEKYPKFGIMINDGTEMVKFYLDMNTKKLIPAVGTVHQVSGGEDNWANQDYFNLDETLDLSKKKVTLALLRNGKTYYFYVNDELVATGSDLSDNASAAGIFSFGTSVKLSDYELVTSGDKYNKLLSEAKKDVAEFNQFSLTTNYFSESKDGVYKLKTNSDDESKVDDVKYAGKVLKTPYYNIKGKLILKNSKDWSQARILVSSDSKNEYVIALEQTAKNKYQIFTMSKNNEDTWNNWTSIVGAEINGDRNSIDFEVIADGKKVYFLIDDVICYTSDRVAMKESTVKFSGYKNATTVVENLDGHIFASSVAVQKYIAKKDAESFWTYGLTTNYFKETKEGVYSFKATSNDESKVDDVVYGGNIMKESYYSVKGKLSLTNATDWSQARILISSDPKNEYVIALEKTDEDLYQIFTMSKPNEDIWNNWTAIVDAEVNEDRNSIDFEVIVDGEKVYFLIDNQIYYTADHVAMKESTVKFAGYGKATVTVENIDAYIFARQVDVQNYLKSKTKKDFGGENFGVTVGDGITYLTTDGINLEKDIGENPTIKMYKGAPRYAYLSDTFTEKVYFETQISVSKILNDDAYPKFGIILNGKTESLKFFVDMNAEMKASAVGVVHQPTDGGDDWANAKTANVGNMMFTNGDKVKLAVARDGKAYYFYVNDKLVLVEDYALAEEKTAVGIFSFNTVLIASDYKVFTGSEADSYITQAKADAKFTLSTYQFVETQDGVYQLTTSTQDEGKVDNVERAGNIVRAAYYRVKGNISSTDAAAWGQARILISSDAKNEHVIALEKTDKNIYQIFAMSKNNEEIWQNWTAIVDAEVNKDKNSLDFEVIADGEKVYFLIDDLIYYTSDRVSVEESTVKFASYGNATTTVKNLDGYIFESKEDVQEYLETKSVKEFKGENFGETVGDGITYTTTDGINLETDKGENPTIDIYKGTPRYAYLNDSYTNKFYFEAEINVREVLNNDGYPKFGLMFNGKSEMVKYFVDMNSQMEASHVGVVHQKTGQGDDWGGSISTAVSDMKFKGSDKVKLALVRDGRDYYFYVNDSLVLSRKNTLYNESGAVGIFSFNAVMTASNYKFYKGADADSYIAAAKAVAGANFFGAANGLTTTPDVDLSKDTGALTGTVTVNTGDSKFMYARDFYQENYYFETKVHVNQIYNNDGYPKFGILVQDGTVQELFFVDMRTDKTSSTVGVVHDYNWGGSVSTSVNGMNFSGEGEYVALGLLKQGGTFTFYVNGNQVLTYNSSFTGKTTVGVFGFNTGMTLKEYYVEKK